MHDLDDQIRKRPNIFLNQENSDYENLTRTIYSDDKTTSDDLSRISPPSNIPTTIKTRTQELHLYYDLKISALQHEHLQEKPPLFPSDSTHFISPEKDAMGALGFLHSLDLLVIEAPGIKCKRCEYLKGKVKPEKKTVRTDR